jgi:hypothetical protein
VYRVETTGTRNGLKLCGGDFAQIRNQSRLALLLTINQCSA